MAEIEDDDGTRAGELLSGLDESSWNSMTFPRCFVWRRTRVCLQFESLSKLAALRGWCWWAFYRFFHFSTQWKLTVFTFYLKMLKCNLEILFNFSKVEKMVNNIFLYRFSNLAKCRFMCSSPHSSIGTTMTWERGIMLKKQKLNLIKISAMGRNGMKAMSVVW